jgi:hypothetical protein
MKKLMHGVLVILGAGLACTAQGGTITSGSFHVLNAGLLSATVSGDNFTATVIDTDGGPFLLGGFPPFQAPPIVPELTWGGDISSGVMYNGVFYRVTDGLCCSQGPFASVSFTEDLISSKPIVTGPGTYSLDLFAVTLHFSLFEDLSHMVFYSETDTGFATGSITYTALIPGNPFVFSTGFDATIIPEPSSWSFIAIAACLLGAFTWIIPRFRQRIA